MAHGARLQIPGFMVSSAGTRAVIGHSIHPEAVVVLDRYGGDASDFAARQFSQKIASRADLVLVMTRAHRDTALGLAPRMLHRTFTLTEAARLASAPNSHSVADLAAVRSQLASHELPDIPDPIAHGPEVFAAVGAQIAGLLPPIMEFCRRASVSAAE